MSIESLTDFPLSAQDWYRREIAQIALLGQNLSAIHVLQRLSENERERFVARNQAPSEPE
jgi:hypothetical protein